MSTTRSEARAPEANEQAASYVLPKPGRGGNELVLPVSRPNALQRHREAEVARSIGSRVNALVECQRQFLGELRTCLQEIEDTVAEAARVRLQGQVRTALSVLEWCDAVQSDLQSESGWAERGLHPIELAGFCREVAAAWNTGAVSVEVIGGCAELWWGHAGLLAETIEAGLVLVAERTRDARSLVLEVGGDRDTTTLRFAGVGEIADEVEPTTARLFRQNVERLGARVEPDSSEPAGTGLVLALPAASDGLQA